MNVLPMPASLNANDEDRQRLQHCWVWFVVLGIAVGLIGLSAIGSAFIATLASVFLFGCLLVAGGVVQLVNAFMVRSWRAFSLYLIGAIVHLVIGLLMIDHPLAAAAGITLVIAGGFFVGGLLRIIYGLAESFPGRGWVLLNGGITLLLGVAIWRQWPESSLWVIGLFVGVDLVFNGISWIMLGLELKSMGALADSAAPAPHDAVPAGR